MSSARDDSGLAPPPLDDDERAYRASLEQLVDWVRVEQAPVLLRAFLPAALLLVPLGGALLALSCAERLVTDEQAPWLLAVGMLLTASGPIWALASLIRSMQVDAYVAIRVDGLAVRLDTRRAEVVHSWESVSDAQPDESAQAVRLELATGATVVLCGPFSGVTEAELARRIRDARRLGVWRRLSPRGGI